MIIYLNTVIEWICEISLISFILCSHYGNLSTRDSLMMYLARAASIPS